MSTVDDHRKPSPSDDQARDSVHSFEDLAGLLPNDRCEARRFGSTGKQRMTHNGVVNDDGAEKVPLPIAQSSLEEAGASAFAADLADPATPLGAASLWHSALEDRKRNMVALRTLSANPSAWGDYSEAAANLSDMSIMTVVEDCPDDDGIKYVKFIHFAGEVGVALAVAPLNDVWAVTMLRVPGPLTWKVWGLSRNRFPSSDQVRI